MNKLKEYSVNLSQKAEQEKIFPNDLYKISLKFATMRGVSYVL